MEYYAGDRLIGGLEPCEENLARIEELLDDNGLHLDINGFVVPEDESAWDDETEIPR